ncbi:hypothetical protein AMECASPLE_016932 [Ameca splendens]|uniref:Uncharacterized protein n=1 Tax=Ameca splendens TaxID=208324 RepID=A0ABV0YP97_9TELE
MENPDLLEKNVLCSEETKIGQCAKNDKFGGVKRKALKTLPSFKHHPKQTPSNHDRKPQINVIFMFMMSDCDLLPELYLLVCCHFKKNRSNMIRAITQKASTCLAGAKCRLINRIIRS